MIKKHVYLSQGLNLLWTDYKNINRQVQWPAHETSESKEQKNGYVRLKMTLVKCLHWNTESYLSFKLKL